MTDPDEPATESERREAELLALALEDRTAGEGELASVEDALGAAWMVKASRSGGLSDRRARAVLERAWPNRSWMRRRAVVAALGAAAAGVAILLAQPRPPAVLPAPPPRLLRAQLEAARRGAPAAIVPLEQELAAYRRDVYAALGRAYGSKR